MRLFVALPLPAAVRRELADAAAAVRPDAPAGLRWAPPERWHLTLAFLGEVPDAALPELERRLGRAAARHPQPTLRLAGAGRFDGRVLWAGVRGDVPSLQALASSVSAAARRTGIAVEERRYRPHLTLARASTSLDLRPLVSSLADLETRSWTAPAVALVRSRLGPHPSYETLTEHPLVAVTG